MALFAEHIGGDSSLVTANDVSTWLDWMACAPEERRQRVSALRVFFRWSRAEGYIATNPTFRTYSRTRTGPPRSSFPAEWATAFDEWAKFMRVGGRPDTTIDMRRLAIARVARELGGVGPWEVTRHQLVELLAAKQWSAQTRRSHRTTLRGFYRWAVAYGYTQEDPAMHLPTVPTLAGQPRPAPADRIRFALAGADDRVRLMILLGAKMGLRRGEIARVHADDITPRGLIVHGKGGRARMIPIPPELDQALARWRDTHEYVFASSSSDGHVTAAYVGKLMSAQLGEGLTAHMLRHRFATVAYAADSNLLAVQQLLGHSKPETTQIYVQVDESALATAVAAAAKL